MLLHSYSLPLYQNYYNHILDGTPTYSSLALTIKKTSSAGQSGGGSGLEWYIGSDESIRLYLQCTDGGAQDNQYSERYWFPNGMVWGLCSASTGPSAAEFLNCFSAGIDSTSGKGYRLPEVSSNLSSWDNDAYNEDFGEHYITASTAGTYIFFGWPDQGGNTGGKSGYNNLTLKYYYSGHNNRSAIYQISYLEETNVIIANIDKPTELANDVGDDGYIIIPDKLDKDIKDNLDFFLEKAGYKEGKPPERIPNRKE